MEVWSISRLVLVSADTQDFWAKGSSIKGGEWKTEESNTNKQLPTVTIIIMSHSNK